MASQFGGISVAAPAASPINSGSPAIPAIAGMNAPSTADAVLPGGVPLPTASSNRNENYLKTLSPGIANYVKAISDGRAPLPQGFVMKTPFGQALVQAIGKYDPSFDVANANARIAMRKAATSGDLGKNITSLNTVLGHLDKLNSTIDALHNTNNPWYNAEIANPLSAQQPGTVMGTIGGMLGVNDTSYQKALKDFQSARAAATRELTRAFRGASGSESDVQDYGKLFDENAAPSALKEGVKSQIGLLQSRLQAAADQYNRGMGTTAQPLQFLTPANQAILKKLESENTDNPVQTGGSPAPDQGADINALLKKYGAHP